MTKNNKISRGLIERAVAELNREVPKQEVLIEHLGVFGAEVEAFVKILAETKFFSNVGKPIQHPDKGKVERVTNWNSAIELSHLEERTELINSAAETSRRLIKRFDRQSLSDAAFDLYNEYATLSIPQEVRGTVRGALYYAIEGALNEIIIQDVSDAHFFLDLFYWYEQGHWPCAVKEDGTVIVF